MCLHLVSRSDEVGPNHFYGLALIKSNFYTSLTFAVAQKVIVLDVGGNDVLDIGNLLDLLVIAVLRQS